MGEISGEPVPVRGEFRKGRHIMILLGHYKNWLLFFYDRNNLKNLKLQETGDQHVKGMRDLWQGPPGGLQCESCAQQDQEALVPESPEGKGLKGRPDQEDEGMHELHQIGIGCQALNGVFKPQPTKGETDFHGRPSPRPPDGQRQAHVLRQGGHLA